LGHGAAALAGAPLGHDFCAISLSDLLTPWPVIEQRLRAAADGDFVVALYNPASNRRRRGLARALEILAAARPPATPVVVARAVGRDAQAIRITSLRDLDQASVDMMTLLIVGSTETRVTGGRVYTPRGYRAKRGSEAPA
ncbi:MAG: precorrin-3B C(17)-methyltransferase, partial [Thiotrichales bacterium]|nr:precorrin-3B C(17)-methyltransferase [Thiotrichales bacterium]